jgi:hypothetical protein
VKIAIFWTLIAVYGIVIQVFNTRWALYKWRTVHALANPTSDQLGVVRTVLFMNAVRGIAVIINFTIGLLAVFSPAPHGPVTVTGVLAVIGFIINELLWDSLITLEIVERSRMRRASA